MGMMIETNGRKEFDIVLFNILFSKMICLLWNYLENLVTGFI